jgi:Putative zinc ribbon domain
MATLCIACGMPMEKIEDFALGDRSKNYCRFCALPDGKMQNYAEKLKSLTSFMVRTQGLTSEAAQEAAKEMMSKLPAWSGI